MMRNAMAASDSMCIGFFIDNELSFPTNSAYYEPYFRACKEALESAAPKFDRPYSQLTEAARIIGESMYETRYGGN